MPTSASCVAGPTTGQCTALLGVHIMCLAAETGVGFLTMVIRGALILSIHGALSYGCMHPSCVKWPCSRVGSNATAHCTPASALDPAVPATARHRPAGAAAALALLRRSHGWCTIRASADAKLVRNCMPTKAPATAACALCTHAGKKRRERRCAHGPPCSSRVPNAMGPAQLKYVKPLHVWPPLCHLR